MTASKYTPRKSSSERLSPMVDSFGAGGETQMLFNAAMESGIANIVAKQPSLKAKIINGVLSAMDSSYPTDIPYLAFISSDNLYVHTYSIEATMGQINLGTYESEIPFSIFNGTAGQASKDGQEIIATMITPDRMCSEPNIEGLIYDDLVGRGIVDDAVITHKVYAGTTSVPKTHVITEDDPTLFANGFSSILYERGIAEGEFEMASMSAMRAIPFTVATSFRQGNLVTDMMGNANSAAFTVNLQQRSSQKGRANEMATARRINDALNLGAIYGYIDQQFIGTTSRNRILDDQNRNSQDGARRYDKQLSYKALMVIKGCTRPPKSTSLQNTLLQMAAIPLLDQNWAWWDAFSVTGARNPAIDYSLATVGYETNPGCDYSKDINMHNPEVIGAPIDTSIAVMPRSTWEGIMSRLYMDNLAVAVAIPRAGDAAILLECFDGSWWGYQQLVQAAIDITDGHFANYFNIKSSADDKNGDPIVLKRICTRPTGTYSRSSNGTSVYADIAEQLMYLSVAEFYKGDPQKMTEWSGIMDGGNQAAITTITCCRNFLDAKLGQGNWTETGEENIQQISTGFFAALVAGLRANQAVKDGTLVGNGITYITENNGYAPTRADERETGIIMEDSMFNGNNNTSAASNNGNYTTTGFNGNNRNRGW